MAIPQLKRVVILESDDLFSAGIQSFLNNRDELEVTGLSLEDMEVITQMLQEIQPNVIILEQNSLAIFLALIEKIDFLQHVRLVAVNRSDNQVKVYERNNIAILQLSDFLSVI